MLAANEDLVVARYSAFNPYRLRCRDLGFQLPNGSRDAMARSLYGNMKPIFSWTCNDSASPTGGIFNLEFSPDGNILVAACEKKSIQMFDPVNQHIIHCIDDAHLDCINCVKFLDSRLFATCSDDTTIALWDIRNLSRKVRSLVGHSKWVKNIEFSQKDRLLVTSGLDGSVYAWDINSYTENNLVYERVFHTSSLMRCKLTPDSRQMVLSTTGGLIVLIHDLNLSTLRRDLTGFKPNLYRLMQMSQQVIPIASKYDHLFKPDRKENRVEFIADFPEGNDAEVVSSLQIHPHAWTVLSRNISHDDKSEWTCVHDIQPSDPRATDKGTRDTTTHYAQYPPAAYRSSPASHLVPALRSPPAVRAPPAPPRSPPAPPAPPSTPAPRRARLPPHRTQSPLTLRRSPRFTQSPDPNEAPTPRRSPRLHVPQPAEREDGGSHSEREREPVAGPSNEAASSRSSSRSSSVAGSVTGSASGLDTAINASADAAASRLGRGTQSDLWEASVTVKQYRLLQEAFNRGAGRRSFNMHRITGFNTGITPSSPSSSPPPPDDTMHSDTDQPSGQPESERSSEETAERMRASIVKNKDRLLYYIEETNQGKGFIKELCYSGDGRIVCSPFGKGVRLMSMNENCSEISTIINDFKAPTEMYEISQSLGHHSDLVVCCKFNPRFDMLVSGCLEGRIVWYQPFCGQVMGLFS